MKEATAGTPTTARSSSTAGTPITPGMLNSRDASHSKDYFTQATTERRETHYRRQLYQGCQLGFRNSRYADNSGGTNNSMDIKGTVA
jgi:hypothetical protein